MLLADSSQCFKHHNIFRDKTIVSYSTPLVWRMATEIACKLGSEIGSRSWKVHYTLWLSRVIASALTPDSHSVNASTASKTDMPTKSGGLGSQPEAIKRWQRQSLGSRPRTQ